MPYLLKIAVLMLLCLSIVGCPKDGRGLRAARKAVELAAETTHYVDVSFSTLYTEQADKALAACDDTECYVAEMVKWDKTVLALREVKLSLLMVQTSLDAWEHGVGNANFHSAALCLLASFKHLDGLFTDLDVKLPKDFLAQAISTGSNLFNLNPDAEQALCGAP